MQNAINKFAVYLLKSTHATISLRNQNLAYIVEQILTIVSINYFFSAGGQQFLCYLSGEYHFIKTLQI